MLSARNDRERKNGGSSRRANDEERGREDLPRRGWSRPEGSLHGGAMIGAAVEAQQYLAGVEYPATRDELAAHAELSGAPEHVRSLLGRLAEQRFGGPGDVVGAIRALR